METLRKELGTVRLTFYGVGTIVGAGIYAIIGVVAGQAGHGMWLAFVFAAVAASLSALSYSELSSAFPKAGAEYVFLRQAFPRKPVISFITGYFITVHGAATFATVVLAFAGYFTRFWDVPSLQTAYIVLALSTVFNISGIRKASWINVAFTSAQILGLLLLVYAGVTSPEFGEVLTLPVVIEWNLFAATATTFYVFTGYEHMATMAEEAREPGKTIPRAFIFSLLFTTVIYLLIVLAALALVSPQALAGSDSPLALAGAKRFPWMGTVIAIGALLATANVSLSASLSVSRMMYGMSSQGDMPRLLSRLSPQKSPWVAAILLAVAVGILIPFGKIKLVASISSLGALMVFALVNLAVIVLRFRQPELERPFRVPLAFGRFPVLPALGVLVSVLLATLFDSEVYLIFLIAVIVGVAAYRFGTSGSRPNAEAPEKIWGH